jgi:GNAT superfamily N-acetyltransferase
VRSASAADAAVLGALWGEMARTCEPFGEEWTLSDGAAERFAQSVPERVGNPRSLCLIAEIEIDGASRPAGFLLASVKLRSSAYRESVVGEIAAIHVAADAVGRGVGTALLGQALEWMRKRGIAHAETTAPVPDSATGAFLRAMGFRESASTFRAALGPAPADAPISGPLP